MNLLLINQADVYGGAAIAAYRLHQGFLNRRMNSRLLVAGALSQDPRVEVIRRLPRIEDRLLSCSKWLGLHSLNVVSTFATLPKHPFFREADVLNFHNLHTGYFNYMAIPYLTRKKPAVLTLHDMWSFTGHCAYSYGCGRWEIGCGQCPHPDLYVAIKKDHTRLEWKLKDWAYQRSDLAVVAPSRWLVEQAGKSMLKRFPIHHIAYGLDLEIYRPLDPEECRLELGIPLGKKVLMFCAPNLIDPRKGGDLLVTILQNLPASLKTETVLLTMGDFSALIPEGIGMATVHLGYVHDERVKAVAFSAADLFLFPTRADNLPVVLQESLACGTPAISFKVGGVPDLVIPGVTGYLAEPENGREFTENIIELLEDKELRLRMRKECRNLAVREFALDQQAGRYLDLFRQVLQ